jgi:hypothetical protein
VCLWSLFNFNQPEWFTSITLTLINTARPAKLNRDLKKWQDIVTAQPWTHPLPVRILSAELVGSNTSWVRRGVIDYMLALKQCMEQGSEWCLVIEEDVVLTRNFIAKLRNVVELSLSPTRVMRDRIGMVKIFVSDHWDGFSWSWTHVKDVAFVALLALMFLMGVLQSMFRVVMTRVSFRQRKSAQKKWILTYLACVVGFYIPWRLMGRQMLVNFLEPRVVHLDPIGPTAGTVGVAFPMTSLPHLCQYLTRQLEVAGKELAPIDLILNQWIVESASFRAFRTTPSLVQHLGVRSSATHKNQGNFQEMKQDSAFVF